MQKLTKQLDNPQLRPTYSHPKTSEFSITDTKSPKRNLSTSATYSPSTGVKTAAQQGSAGKREQAMASELEYCLTNAEYSKAAHLVAQLDYKKPSNISNEKFINLLTAANRLKDSQFNEILNKLKLLMTFTPGQDFSDDPLFFEREDLSAYEKALLLIDEKIPKALIKNEYQLQNRKGEMMNSEQALSLKVDYLNAQLKEAQQKINNKDSEIRKLNEQIRDSNRGFGSPGDTYELRNLREKVEFLERDLQVKQKQLSEVQMAHSQKSEMLDRLVK